MKFARSELAVLACLAAMVLAGVNPQSVSGQTYLGLLPPPPLVPYPPSALPELAPLEFELSDELSTGSAGPVLSGGTVEVIETPVVADADGDTAEAELLPWYHYSRWIRPPGWEKSVEIGLNGSSGTSDTMSIRAGTSMKLATDARKAKFDIYHNRTHANGVQTQNNSNVNFRHEWLRPESAWTLFIQSQLYHDEFQAFDLNLNLNSGFGYRFLDEEWIELTARVGSGASREFGGRDDVWVAEAQFGMDFEEQISDTQKFYANVDYFPEWENFGRFRLTAEMGWEVRLTVPSNTSLKIAATDRFDSDPDGTSPHNLNYSVVLLWKL